VLFAALLCTLAVAWSQPSEAQSVDYPNGAWVSGVIIEVDTFNNMLLFTVSGKTDAGTSGSTRFWIDTNATGGAIRGANVLSAAAQGRSIVVFNYGQSASYGGQTAYISTAEQVSY
jgi:hypothetical protein